MATKRWKGAAKAVTQITTITFSAYTSGETYTVTCGGKSVSFVATASTAANVVDGLVAAIETESAVLVEFSEFTAENDTNELKLTANTAGVPFTVTATASTGTATVTATQAATGTNFFDNADNWSDGTVPAAGDDLVFENSAVSLLYALVDTTNYGDIDIKSTFTGEIGLPATNSIGYPEYRERFLKLGNGSSASAVTIGQGNGAQSARVNLDANQETYTLNVYGSGFSSDEGTAIRVKNMDSSSAINLFGGSVTIDADTSGSAGTVNMTPEDTTASLIISETCTAGAITMTGGQLELWGNASSLDVRGGSVDVFGSAAIPDVDIGQGATVNWASTGGISTKLDVFADGTIDFTNNATAKTVAACDLHRGGTILDPMSAVTWTNGTDWIGCESTADATFVFGRGRTLTSTAA